MWDLFLFGCGCLCGGAIVADWLGLKLAKAGDPFWIGWIEARSFGLWKYERDVEPPKYQGVTPELRKAYEFYVKNYRE